MPEIGGFALGQDSDDSIYLPAHFMAANITGSTQVNSITVVCVSSDNTLLDNVSATIESLYGGLVTVTEPSSLLSSVDSIFPLSRYSCRYCFYLINCGWSRNHELS